MKKKILKKIALMSCLTLGLCAITGCGDTIATNSQSSDDNLKDLVNGNYYVLHEDGTHDAVYLGEITYSSETTSTPSNDRIIWFNGDEDNIPTLYSGDKLVYYTTSELTETFYFERFESFGYTVGLCQLEETVSKRYSVSTDPEDLNTYPNSDADVILESSNDSVIIDTVGGTPLRASDEDNNKSDDSIDTTNQNTYIPTGSSKDTSSMVSRIGTINNLIQDSKYILEIYTGTESLDMNQDIILTANILALGSMESFTSHDYEFTGTVGIIEITLPEWMESGYYLINGQGLFKYINSSEKTDDVDLNIHTSNDYITELKSYNFASIYAEEYSNLTIEDE